MKLKIERKKLLAALSDVECGTQRSGSPLSNHVVIRAHETGVSLITDSQDVRAEVCIDSRADELGQVCVEHNRLVQLLQRQDETVSLESDLSSLYVRLAKFRAVVPAVNMDAFPSERNTDSMWAFVPLDQEFGKSLSLVSGYHGDGKAHAWDVGVHICDTGELMTISATDGRMMCVAKLPSVESKFESLLPGKLCNQIGQRISKADSASMAVYPSHVRFTTDNLTIDVSVVCLKYGPVIALTDMAREKNTSVIELPREQLLCAVRGAGYVLGVNDFGIDIVIGDNSLVVSAKTQSGGQYEEAIECKVSTPARIIINPNYMAKYLHALESDSVRLAYSPDTTIVGVTGDGCDHIGWYCALIRK